MGQIKNIKLHIVTDIKRSIKMLESLLPELVEQIIQYCKVADLQNVALCSTACHAAVSKFVVYAVQVPPSILKTKRSKDVQDLNTRVMQMTDTKILRLHGPGI